MVLVLPVAFFIEPQLFTTTLPVWLAVMALSVFGQAIA